MGCHAVVSHWQRRGVNLAVEHAGTGTGRGPPRRPGPSLLDRGLHSESAKFFELENFEKAVLIMELSTQTAFPALNQIEHMAGQYLWFNTENAITTRSESTLLKRSKRAPAIY